MSEGDFADREADLPAAVSRSLGLRDDGGGDWVIRHDDFLDFVRSDKTLEVLATYKPAPALEAKP
jgi:hypothetical protein